MLSGAPGRIRTCDLRIRSPLLYPAELQAQCQNRSSTKSKTKVRLISSRHFKDGRGEQIWPACVPSRGTITNEPFLSGKPTPWASLPIRPAHLLAGAPKSLLVIRRNASGHLTHSVAWQEFLLARRNATPSCSRAGVRQIQSLNPRYTSLISETWSGRADLNCRPPAPKAGALNQAALRPDLDFQNCLNSIKARTCTTLAFQQNPMRALSFFFELPVRPAHHLAGVPRVARYSSRRHPPTPRQAR